MTCFDYSIDPLLTANIKNAVIRGVAEILEETREGIFIYDPNDRLYVLYAPAELGKEWLKKHEERGYRLLILYDDELIAFTAERYGLAVDEKCKQVVWTRKDKPEQGTKLVLRQADDSDIAWIRGIYNKSSDADILGALRQGTILLGYVEGVPVGMIGMHMEGSMGMLEVLPEYRRRGYGTELEKALIIRQLELGCIPYGHVYLSNAASFALQKSIGMECSEGTLTWLFPKDEEENT